MSRSCPLCRFEWAYSETTTLRGLDDFLKEVTPLFDAPDEPTTSDNELQQKLMILSRLKALLSTRIRYTLI